MRFFDTIKNSVIHALMSSHFRLKLLNMIECYYNFFKANLIVVRDDTLLFESIYYALTNIGGL